MDKKKHNKILKLIEDNLQPEGHFALLSILDKIDTAGIAVQDVRETMDYLKKAGIMEELSFSYNYRLLSPVEIVRNRCLTKTI